MKQQRSNLKSEFLKNSDELRKDRQQRIDSLMNQVSEIRQILNNQQKQLSLKKQRLQGQTNGSFIQDQEINERKKQNFDEKQHKQSQGQNNSKLQDIFGEGKNDDKFRKTYQQIPIQELDNQQQDQLKPNSICSQTISSNAQGPERSFCLNCNIF